jgi:hypothetical protein
MKKVISYTLENDTVPSFVLSGGQFGNGDIMLGISKHNETLPEYVTVYETKEDLLNYLLSYTSEWLENYYHPLGVMHPGTAFDTRPFNAENAANFLWSKLDD